MAFLDIAGEEDWALIKTIIQEFPIENVFLII
jgi:hypothetical protein